MASEVCMTGTCKICERFFDRQREAVGRCVSCGAGYCEEHGVTAAEGEAGACLFCAEEFGSRLDALAE